MPSFCSPFPAETKSRVWDQVPLIGGAAKSTSAAAWQPERGTLRQAQHGQSGGRTQEAWVLWCCCWWGWWGWGWWGHCWPLQVSHLQELVREKEQNLSSAQTQITCLRDTQEKLKIELDATRSRVRETSNLLTDLQVGKRLSDFSFDGIYLNSLWDRPFVLYDNSIPVWFFKLFLCFSVVTRRKGKSFEMFQTPCWINCQLSVTITFLISGFSTSTIEARLWVLLEAISVLLFWLVDCLF